MKTLFGGIALLAIAVAASACGTNGTCNANICAGCCNAAGVCQPGNLNAACGAAGALCDVCTGVNQCANNRCGSGTGGGAGGGGGSGGGLGGGSGGSGGGGGTLGYKRVFVTNAKYSGNLQSAGGAAGGLEGGDALCNTAATAGALGGSWKAWLSDGTNRAVDRITSAGPWKKLDSGRSIVFNNKANLATLPLVPIDYNENGVSLAGSLDEVWTGTDTGGGQAAYHCSGWTGTGGSGRTGRLSDTTQWTQYSSAGCTQTAHLFCFEL